MGCAETKVHVENDPVSKKNDIIKAKTISID
jgi:hypothetical protein